MNRHNEHDELPPGYEDNPIVVSADRGIRISVGLLKTCAVSLVTGTVAIMLFGWKYYDQQRDMAHELAELKKLIRASWTVADEREYTHRLQRDNPTLKLPSPTEVYREVHSDQ
jgi:hypothetical protein